MVSLKRGVTLYGLQPQIVLAVAIAEGIWKEDSEQTLVITSVSDGQHSPRSLHYAGAAVDLRRRDVSLAPEKAQRLSARLGPDFDVILEATHFHIEYQPKRGA